MLIRWLLLLIISTTWRLSAITAVKNDSHNLPSYLPPHHRHNYLNSLNETLKRNPTMTSSSILDNDEVGEIKNDTTECSFSDVENKCSKYFQENYMKLTSTTATSSSANIATVTANDNYLYSTSIIYGLLLHTADSSLTEQCYRQLKMLQDGIHHKDIWAMKALDSSATRQPGFVWGNNFWLGSIIGCESIQTPKHITLSNRFIRNMKTNLLASQAPFDIDYRVVYAKHNSPWQIQVEFLLTEKILHIGLCVPKSCSHSEIANLTQTYLDNNLLDSQSLFEHQSYVMDVKDLKLNSQFFDKKSLKIVGIFLLFTMVMVIMAAMRESSPNLDTSHSIKPINIATINLLENNNNELNVSDKMIQENRNVNNNQIIDDHKIDEQSTTDRIIKCFSLRDNIQTVLSTKSSPTALPVLNAFKSIGCFLILNFHLNWYSYFTIHTPALVFAYGEKFHWLWVSTTPIIVDIFFAISGLLLSYNFLRNSKKIVEIQQNSLWQNIKLFGKQLLHRYLRLSPLYLIVIGITEISISYLVETSPFWVPERTDLTCQQYWWRNILYIQNLFDVPELCLNWTWSMACEMQYFILFSGLLFLYAKNEKLAKTIFSTMFFIFSALVFIIAYKTKFTPAYDVMHDLGTDLYIAPWSRILPYIVGVGSGWALFTSKGLLPLNQKTINLIWTLAATIMISSHMATINRDISYVFAAPIIMAVRIFYSGSACWMIVASALGHGGDWFNRFMNMPIFIHLNKLSYGVYLLNPMVISVIFGLSDHSKHFDPIMQIVMSIGTMVIVYMLSFVFAVLFELPYTNLSNVILKTNNKKVKST